jgi:hypothetical protein
MQSFCIEDLVSSSFSLTTVRRNGGFGLSIVASMKMITTVAMAATSLA